MARISLLVGLTIITTAAILHTGECVSYTYRPLGCYLDKPTDRDLNGVGYSLSTVNLDTCAKLCAEEGFPFVGLQGYQQCFCGSKYGKHGTAYSYHCNYTCPGTDNISCGGHQRNNVYYTIKTDSASRAERVHMAFNEELDFHTARMQCVANNGDLVSPVDDEVKVSIMENIKELGDEVKPRYWVGINRRNPDDKYEWADASLGLINIDSSSYHGYFGSNETFTRDCVYMSTIDQKLYTDECETKYPYACKREPDPEPIPTTESHYGITEEPSEGVSQSTVIAFYVVLPLFCFCYGGSCVAYAIHKLWKSCKKKRREKMRMEAEFENDRQAFIGVASATTHRSSRPVTSRDIDVAADTPPYMKPVHRKPKKQVSPMEDPPRSQTPIERFTNENEEPRRSSAATPKPFVPVMPDNPPPYSPPRSSLNLLPPDSAMEIDFTKLSIQDIIQIKMIMGQSRSTKPKKIVSS